ncbi:17028_t:CDS:2 [Dentiscutata erythropus]|uniref:17028_t:CDS:1 n=1 Tax=Dentiscutata erythropus TaxID=1348616 RepID=A0A9N9CSM0_9GLOM|nr:17028_t:CDS:2 [Dentiscutata erythropus]
MGSIDTDQPWTLENPIRLMNHLTLRSENCDVISEELDDS